MWLVTLGSTFGPEGKQGVVLAVHYQDTEVAVVLTFSPTDRSYRVWDVDGKGGYDKDQETNYTYDSNQAMFRYAERVTHRLFTGYNAKAPGLNWASENGAAR